MDGFDTAIDQWANSYTNAISANYSIDDVDLLLNKTHSEFQKLLDN